MHPSKVHQSTTPQPDSGLQLGFGGVDLRKTAPVARSGLAVKAQDTPTKTKGRLPNFMSSPTFDFTFNRPEADLSEETNRIMESVREEAARIKAALQVEQKKQDEKDNETNQLFGVGGRKLAKPKGKSGRYSDVHKQDFKKMESIASHASVWKSKFQAETTSTSLKRSPSKAALDAGQDILSRTKSFKSMRAEELSDRLENTSPAKRAKQRYNDDTSTARPSSQDASSEVASVQSPQATIKLHSGLPSAVTTPTKSSLARAASVKASKTSMIPSLSRSASTKTHTSPSTSKTEGSNKYMASLARFGNMKSILHRHQPKFSDDPTKIAAGTHLPSPEKKNLDKELPSLPGTPLQDLQHSPSVKRVDFTPSTKPMYDIASISPSPSKIPSLPSQRQATTHTTESTPILYPSLVDSPNITTRAKIPKCPMPGDFTFTSSKTINFGPATSGIKPPSTIRQVRPSGLPTPLPSAFEDLPAIPHGIENKKRHRADSDDENHPPTDQDGEDDGRSVKKQKTAHKEDKPENKTIAKRRGAVTAGSRIPKAGGAKEKSRGVLSLSRLNMLARPKERR